MRKIEEIKFWIAWTSLEQDYFNRTTNNRQWGGLSRIESIISGRVLVQ